MEIVLKTHFQKTLPFFSSDTTLDLIELSFYSTVDPGRVENKIAGSNTYKK